MEKCIAIYLRVSLEDFDLKHDVNKDESNSIFAQRKLIEAYIKGEPTLVGSPAIEFVDDGFTGTNFDRPGFQNMLEQVKVGSITCVIVKDLSRLGRNYLEVGNYVEHLFPFLGVRFIAINDYYDSRDNNGANAGLDLAFKNILHDCYSRDLSVKVRSAQRTRMERGKYVNTPPYGYRCDPKDKHHLIPDPVTSKVVQTIFKMKINGSSTSEIAAYLNQNQIPTPLEAKGVKRREGMRCEKPLMWSHQAVLRILNCYKYTGAMVNHTRENQKLRDRNQKRLPESEWIINKGMHEPLVSEREYNLAHQKIRSVHNYQRKQPDFSTSVFYCAHCGRQLRKTYGKTTYLSCGTFKYQPDAICKSIRWIKYELEDVVLEAFKFHLLHMKAKQQDGAPQKTALAQSYHAEILSLQRQLESQKAERLQMYTEYKLGRIRREDFMAQKSIKSAETKNLTTRIRERQSAHEEQLSADASDKESAAKLNYLSQSSTADSRGEMLQLMYQGLDRVMVNVDGKLNVQWKFETSTISTLFPAKK